MVAARRNPLSGDGRLEEHANFMNLHQKIRENRSNE
jgi:hypothetical protein